MPDNGFGKITDTNIGDGAAPDGNGVEITRTVKARYDFTANGGGVAGAPLGLGVFIPAGAIVVNVILNVLTVPVGPTNVGCGLISGVDLVASAAIAGAPWSTISKTLGVPVWATIANYLVPTTRKEITVTPTVAALTAGKFDLYVTYIPALQS